jgi:hypothetical protein
VIPSKLSGFVFVFSGSRGGVFAARNGKSCIVLVRPPTWKNSWKNSLRWKNSWKNSPSKFWIGKIESFKWAQYIADACFHYCGKPPFHFKNANFTFPPLTCVDAEQLTTAEQCSRYVRSIAGEDFALQREDFLEKVQDVLKSDEFRLQGERFFNENNLEANPREEFEGSRAEECQEKEFEGNRAKEFEGY